MLLKKSDKVLNEEALEAITIGLNGLKPKKSKGVKKERPEKEKVIKTMYGTSGILIDEEYENTNSV